MAQFDSSNHRLAHLTTMAKLPSDLTKPLLDAADCILRDGYRPSYPVSAKVRIDPETIGAHIFVMSKYIPTLAELNEQPYSQAQLDDLQNCTMALELVFQSISEDALEHDGNELRKAICLKIPRCLYEGGVTNSASMFFSPYEPKHDLRVLIEYALYICSNVANEISNVQFASRPVLPKRPSLGRKLTSFGKSVADKLTK